jgi:hypothetical protein
MQQATLRQLLALHSPWFYCSPTPVPTKRPPLLLVCGLTAVQVATWVKKQFALKPALAHAR